MPNKALLKMSAAPDRMEIWDVHCHLSGLPGNTSDERLATEIPMERVLCGSNAPSFYFESATLKLR